MTPVSVRIGFASILSMVLLSMSAPAQKEPDSLEATLLRDVPAWMAEYKVPCVGLGLIENGQIRWAKVFGDVQQGEPAPVNTLFNIASQTKPVAALVALRLAGAGALDLDEPLAHYWIDPDIAGDSNLNKLTARIVLSHQTGFPNWRTDNGGQRLQFLNTPGTKFGYSGEGFEYLRRSLENKFHQPFDKLMDSVVLQPAGMKDTRYWGKDLDTARFARWHDGNGKRYPGSMQTRVNAADDLITTIGDYCRFGIFVMQGAGLPRNLYEEMVSVQTATKDHYNGRSGEGLGWGLVKNLPGGYVLQHGGSDIGVRTMAIFEPVTGRGIVVMANADNGIFVNDRIIKRALPDGEAVLAIMNKGQATHLRITIPDSVIEHYTGSYIQSNGKIMKVVQEGNAVKVSGDGLPTAVLYPESVSKFFLPDYDVQLEFLPADANGPDRLVVYESGKQIMKINKREEEKPVTRPLRPVAISELRKDMEAIASDATEGRFTGSRGLLRASASVVAGLKAVGLEPGWTGEGGKRTFYQPVPFIARTYGAGTAISVLRNRTKLTYHHSAADFVVVHPGLRGTEHAGMRGKDHTGFGGMVFVGYGTGETEAGQNEGKGIDLSGKWVIMLSALPAGAPAAADSLRWRSLVDHKAAGVILLPDQNTSDNWETAVIRQYRFNYIHYAGDTIKTDPVRDLLPVLLVCPRVARAIFAGEGYNPYEVAAKGGVYQPAVLRKTRVSVTIDGKTERILSYNIIARSPGTDVALENQPIVVGAHLDHIGRIGDHIYNGANDDASGCVAVMEAAREIAVHPTARPVYFVFYTAEELNLIGSRHFVSHSPVPVEAIFMNINIEQAGSRHRSFDGIWAIGDPVFKKRFFASGSVFPKQGLRYDAIDGMEEVVSNCDTWSFVKRKLPSIVLGSGGFPEHHLVTDKIGLIDFVHLRKSSILLSSLLVSLANGPDFR